MASILIVLVLLATALVLLRWWSRPPATREPCCAACGYDIRGLAGPTCPECGADLRQVGAISRVDRRDQTGLSTRLACWSGAMLLLGLMATSIASEIPTAFKQRMTWFVILNAPREFGYAALRIECVDTAWREAALRPTRGSIAMIRTGSGGGNAIGAAAGSGPAITFDRSDMTLRIADGEAQPLTAISLRAWLASAGATGSPEQLDYQARVLTVAATSMNINAALDEARVNVPGPGLAPARGRSIMFAGGGSGSFGGPVLSHQLAQRIVIMLFTSLGILGWIIIVRRTRRLDG